MTRIQLKRPIAFLLTICMVFGVFLIPETQAIYADTHFLQAQNAIDMYYGISQNKVLDDWEELAAVYAYLEGQAENSYATGVDISDYVLPATGIGAGGLFSALMKGDVTTASTLALSLVSDGAIKDPGLVSTYAFNVLAIEAYNRSAGISQVVYNAAGAIEHLLTARNTDDGHGYIFWGEPSYDTAGLVLAALSLPVFSDYPNIEAERADLIEWMKAGQENTGAFSAFGSESANSTACVLYGLSASREDLSTWTTSPATGLVNPNLYNDTDGWFTSWSGSWDAYSTKQATLALLEVNNNVSFYANMELNSTHYISATMQLVKPDGSYVEKAVTVPAGSTLDSVASIVSGSAITGGFNYYKDGILLASDSSISDGSTILGVADNFSDITYFSYNGSGVGKPVANVDFGEAADFSIKNLALSTGEIISLPYVSVDVNADTMSDVVGDVAGNVCVVPIHPVTDLEALEFTWDNSTFSNVRQIPTGSAILPAQINMASGGTQIKTVSVRIEGPTANVAYYSAYDVTGDGRNQLVAGDAVTQVLSAANIEYIYTSGYLGAVDGIFAGSYDPNFYDGWVYYINGIPGAGLGSQTISDGDEIVVYYGYYPGWGTDLVTLKSTVIEDSVTLTIMNGEVPVPGVTVNWDGEDLPEATDEQGQVIIDGVAVGTYPVQIVKSDEYGVPQIVRFPEGTKVIVTEEGETASGNGSGLTETSQKVFLTVKGLNGSTLLAKTGQTYYVGITARDVLDHSGLTVSGSGNYVSSIDNLSEFDFGPGSGWLYKVNGNLYGSTPADDYELDIDDSVLWYYTSDYTRDRSVTDFLGELEEEAVEVIIPEATAVNGVATVTVLDTEMMSAIESALDNGITQIIIAPSIFGETNKLIINLSAEAVADIANHPMMSFVLKTEIGTITFSNEALSAISTEGGNTVSFSIAQIEKEMLSEKDKARIADRPIVSLSVSVDNKKVNHFGEGYATVKLPYTLGEDEDPNAVVVYYINTEGELDPIRGAYNKETDTVDFTVNHFSEYAIGYNKVAFSDVSSTEWYSAAVNFLAAREITNGIQANQFSPNTTLTRGQFIVMLMRAYGLEPLEDTADNFADAGNTYYTGYLASAKKLEISNGVGNNQFAPDQQISRQDMFTLLYRALAVLGEAPDSASDSALSAFSDNIEIADYAKPAMEAFVANGIVAGSDGNLSPKGLTTRAQMAQVLYNLLSE